MKKRRSQLEIIIHSRILFAGVGEPVTEYRFHPTRKRRFDFAFPDKKIAIEAEGAVWVGGRHTRGSGFTKDSEKYNEAAIMGWRVLRYTSGTIGRIIPDLTRIFKEGV